jgi:hypothetical protein
VKAYRELPDLNLVLKALEPLHEQRQIPMTFVATVTDSGHAGDA